MITSRTAQLDLWQQELDALPWGGQSPRALTRVGSGLILKPEAQKSMSDLDLDPSQLELWPANNNAPWRYQGAPLLKEVYDAREA